MCKVTLHYMPEGSTYLTVSESAIIGQSIKIEWFMFCFMLGSLGFKSQYEAFYHNVLLG
jgi:hypothetical protein